MNKVVVLAYFAIPVIVVALVVLGGCTAVQVQTAAARIAAACQVAVPLAGRALALPEAGPFIAAGVIAGCTTDVGLARLAADPASAEWLDRQAALLRGALSFSRG